MIIMGTNSADQLYGLGGGDFMFGLDGNDLLDGGNGGDVMYGGKGDDIYVVSEIYVDDPDDVVIEYANEGIDTVRANCHYTLGANVENLELMAPPFGGWSGGFVGTGNSLNNRITGNDWNNTLSGLGGDDVLNGGKGQDTLLGSDGIDILDGGLDFDSMDGGLGNDTFYVDHQYDTVIESSASSGGIDRVILQAPLSYTLPSYVEHLELLSTSTAFQSARGNSLNNHISGGIGDDTILGMKGHDRLSGHGGNDSIFGNEGNDVLIGTSSTTNGQGEIDTLVGGSGNDRFVLAQALTSTGVDYYSDNSPLTPGLSDYALIYDFVAGQDKIQLRGSASRYVIQDVTLDSVSGAGIYIRSNISPTLSELVGVVKGVSASALNLAGSSFIYDQYQPPT